MLDRITTSLYPVFNQAPVMKLSRGARLVIFSDLHLGNRGRGDDFLKNSSLFMDILKHYYLSAGWALVLNGDIEELHRFSLQNIERSWPDLYALLAEFYDRGRLHKIVGNHDIALSLYGEYPFHDRLLAALRLQFRGNDLFIFHGHQASGFQTRFNLLTGFLLRYVARPLGISSYSVSQNKLRQYRMERRVYAFSQANRIASIMGHTHRPLFESLSKVDFLRFRIEALCREYTTARPRAKRKLSADIRKHKAELDHIYGTKGEPKVRRSIYNSRLLIPCLFNSGCCIGKRGVTAIEISEGDIALVHWFDRKRSRKHFQLEEQEPQRLGESDYFRVVLNRDNLDYIFTRIRLLTD